MTAKYLKKNYVPNLVSFLRVSTFGIIYFVVLTANISCFAEDYHSFEGIIQVVTNVSDGAYSPSQVVNLAKERGIKIIFFNDSLFRKAEYGIRPFENLIKIKKEEPSVFRYGIKKYLKEIEDLNRQYPDMVVFAGVEAYPFYWWQGSPLKGKLFNFDLNKHLFVFGLTAKDYEFLPVIGKRYILPQNFKSLILFFISILAIFVGMRLIRLRIRRFSYLGYTIFILGILFLLNNFPFPYKYDAYHGDKGYKPYQEFIDYVKKRGGFVFWAHPEYEFSRSLGKVDLYTLKYPDVLTNTFDYDGFGGVFPGHISSCLAGREWDIILKEFCLGQRKMPIWIIGEVDFDGTTTAEIDSIQTIFFSKHLDKDSILESLRKGRYYARRHTADCYVDLESFTLQNSMMGESVIVKNKPKLVIKGAANMNPDTKIRLEIIRSAETIKAYEILKGRFDLEFIDEEYQKITGKSYYRINFFSGDNLILASNPIFYEAK